MISPSEPSEEYGELQSLVDYLYRDDPRARVKRVDVLVDAEAWDLSDDLREVVRLLPAGTYSRQRLCDQLNSIITAHGWAYLYGTVE